MVSKRKSRKTNPVIFVFCEGDTEQRYVDLLRQYFRVSALIVTKVLNTRITQRVVENNIRISGYPDVDKIFLFYDGDRQDIVDRLHGIYNAELLLSYPCVELWFLLHYEEHNGYIDSNSIVKLLQKHYPAYKKGQIQNPLAEKLIKNWEYAAIRAKRCVAGINPSTTVYLLPEYLSVVRKW